MCHTYAIFAWQPLGEGAEADHPMEAAVPDRDVRSVRGQLSGGGRSRRRQGRLSPLRRGRHQENLRSALRRRGGCRGHSQYIVDCTDIPIIKGLQEDSDCSARLGSPVCESSRSSGDWLALTGCSRPETPVAVARRHRRAERDDRADLPHRCPEAKTVRAHGPHRSMIGALVDHCPLTPKGCLSRSPNCRRCRSRLRVRHRARAG